MLSDLVARAEDLAARPFPSSPAGEWDWIDGGASSGPDTLVAA